MKYENLDIPEPYLNKFGIKPFTLSNLQSVVALFGRNGAGKTRILNCLNIHTINGTLKNNIKINETENEDEDDIDQYMKMHTIKIDINKIINSISVKPTKFNNVISYLIDNPLKRRDENEIDIILPEIIEFLQNLSDKYIQEKFLVSTEEIAESESKNIRIFTSFKKHMSNLFSKVDINTNQATTAFKGILQLNDRKFEIKELSEGQKYIFVFYFLFFLLEHNGKMKIKNSIIIIDEFETHLHPENQIMLIDFLKDVVKEGGQLWIASHSPSLLAHLDWNEIFMVKDSTIIPKESQTPTNSLIELMGTEDHCYRLGEFINNTSDWAFANFIVQCFSKPDVMESIRKNDKQFEAFKKFLKEEIIGENTKYKKNYDIGHKFRQSKLLDFGAGKGRLATMIKEDSILRNVIDYYAWEPCPNLRKFLSENLNIPKQNIILDIKRMKSIKFQIIVLCNVLHEIEPSKWRSVFCNIKEILEDTGYLIFIEDEIMPKGERPNNKIGYLVLDYDELKALLKIKDNELPNYYLKEWNDDEKKRILCTAISQQQIKEIEFEDVISVLNMMKKRAEKNVQFITKNYASKDAKQGRIKAFYNQLYFNAKFAIEDLEKTKRFK